MTTTRQDISSRKLPTVRQCNGHPLMVTLVRAAESVARTGEARYVIASHGGYSIEAAAPAVGTYYEFTKSGRWLVEA